MTLQPAPLRSIGEVHAELIERGIFTKSMVGTVDKCPIRLGLRHGWITGTEEKHVPGFAAAYGGLNHGLIETWASREIRGELLPYEEVRQLLHDRWPGAMQGADGVPPPSHRDGYVDRLVALHRQWRAIHRKGYYGKLVGTERSYGYDGSVLLGGIPIAGHVDLLYERAVLDPKTCNQRSGYRKPGPFTYELAHYSALTGLPDAGFVPHVHDLAVPKTEVALITVTEQAKQVAACKLERVAELVSKAKQSPGVLTPPPEGPMSGIGKGLCTPRFCGYFGTVCPVTKHLKREDFA